LRGNALQGLLVMKIYRKIPIRFFTIGCSHLKLM
jgi:hypothetical protein